MQKAPSEMIGRGFWYASVNVYRRSMTSAFGYFFCRNGNRRYSNYGLFDMR